MRSFSAGVSILFSALASVAPQASHEEFFATVVVGGAVASIAPGVDVPSTTLPRGRNRKHPDDSMSRRQPARARLVHATSN